MSQQDQVCSTFEAWMISAEKASGLSDQSFESQTMNFHVLEEAAAHHAIGIYVLTSASELQAA